MFTEMFRLLITLVLISAVAALSANEKLKQCCSTLQGADKECVDKFCDFSGISQTNVLSFLSTCTERGPTVGNMWDCASLRHDHSSCCINKGVAEGCLPYCRAQEGVPTNYVDYLFCMDDFNLIRDCFQEHLEKNEPFKNVY